jgi:hypothetical protein
MHLMITMELFSTILCLLAHGRKVQAIKAVRCSGGVILGLREAKSIVDTIEEDRFHVWPGQEMGGEQYISLKI